MGEQLYTRTGDDGSTGLLGPGRVQKFSAQVEAYGSVDELSAALGVCRATSSSASQGLLLDVQRDLYHLMAELAATPENAARFHRIDAARVRWLEGHTDALTGGIVLPREFVIPGDSLAGAQVDFARTVARRAERAVLAHAHNGGHVHADVIAYLNRLSSFLFVLSLVESARAGVGAITLAKSETNPLE
ncbi:MAG: cob(I)yrinic acid a,c-diamide adenosyltransferase [Thermoflexales bacterium]|nr:cob(I)yrinic acid a,c-diamide adenosyltransferase [Thermoflexales bacterium]